MLHHDGHQSMGKATGRRCGELTKTVSVCAIDDLVLVRLNDLEATERARLRESTGGVVGDDPRNGFGVRLVPPPIQTRIRTAVGLILSRMVVLRHAQSLAATFQAVHQGTTKFIIRHFG